MSAPDAAALRAPESTCTLDAVLCAPHSLLRAALHPLCAPPLPPGWNRAQLSDVIGAAVLAPAAVLVPLCARAEGLNVLFTRRVAGLRQHAGQVSFPGGRSDADDRDALATALRESAEEIGLHAASAEPLGYLDCFDTISGYSVTPVVARIAADFVARPNPDEVAEVFEIPLAWLSDPLNLHTRQVDYRGRARTIYEFKPAGHLIWGATAGILVNLLARMRT
ncbi:CoA pyrophosphatase [Metallibacterium sp.]|jgi:8-oxo-dGTP pyrophosphatase MutT (NUDIX family)|uniref:CoA pyrophosphatase n=1 Tax=Metallibacterium sp. TaxID=2940281 RepID=UPI0026181690|nr:CoA pyrophosphatase [Metallibacterium sp.]